MHSHCLNGRGGRLHADQTTSLAPSVKSGFTKSAATRNARDTETTHKTHHKMNSIGKKARKSTGMNRFELKRSNRVKARHARLADPDYNPNIGTNARKGHTK